MATTLDFTLSVAFGGNFTNTLDFSSPKAAYSVPFSGTLANGTGADQADMVWWDDRSVSSGSPDDIDVNGQTGAFGVVQAFAKIKGIFIINKTTTSSAILNVGGGSNNFVNWVAAAGDIIKIGPGGCFLLYNPAAAGYAVTDSTGDILRIAAAAGTIDYRIALIGTSA